MKDEIIEELWKSKDEIAKEYGYNIRKLVKKLKLKEKKESVSIIDFSKNIKTTSLKYSHTK